MMRFAVGTFLFLLLFLTACDKPEPTPIKVGAHEVTLFAPTDWEHLDYGEQHLWRRDFERISIHDMGTMGTNIDLAAEFALKKLRDSERREIASRDTLLIDSRDARLIDTWETVSHQYPKRYLFVLNDRSLLVLYTMQGRLDIMAEQYDKMAASLAFVDSVGHQP